MNRGLTHRTVFENRKDRRTFLSLLARAVREGRIELHSYCLLTTHFHLLVRSIDGRLSETMRRRAGSASRSRSNAVCTLCAKSPMRQPALNECEGIEQHDPLALSFDRLSLNGV